VAVPSAFQASTRTVPPTSRFTSGLAWSAAPAAGGRSRTSRLHLRPPRRRHSCVVRPAPGAEIAAAAKARAQQQQVHRA
jgi:hypothetical protein